MQNERLKPSAGDADAAQVDWDGPKAFAVIEIAGPARLQDGNRPVADKIIEPFQRGRRQIRRRFAGPLDQNCFCGASEKIWGEEILIAARR